ncbi:unnamed protein product, partial [Pocillopora meandrina]
WTGHCQSENWIKAGCRKDTAREMVLLFSDRNPGSTVKINWSHWKPYLISLACRCATEAKRQNLQWFALQYYGECWGSSESLKELFPRYPIDSEDRCVGESFKPCKEEDPKSMCVGRAFRVYFYEFKKQPGKQVSHQGIASGGGYGCRRAVDVAFVIDTSGSVTQANFNRIIQFLKLFVDRFDFPDSGTRFALLRYDHHVCIDLTLEDSVLYSLHGVKNKVGEMRYTGGSTLTHLALKEVKDKIFKGAPRHGVPRTCILMTDGITHGGSLAVKQPSSYLRTLGVHIIAIGVGSDVDSRELAYIAEKNVILLTSFDEVLAKAHQTIEQLVRGTCGTGH